MFLFIWLIRNEDSKNVVNDVKLNYAVSKEPSQGIKVFGNTKLSIEICSFDIAFVDTIRL